MKCFENLIGCLVDKERTVLVKKKETLLLKIGRNGVKNEEGLVGYIFFFLVKKRKNLRDWNEMEKLQPAVLFVL